MNFNANNSSSRQPFARKLKRVSDVNAMGYPYNPYNQINQPSFTSGPEMSAPVYPAEYIPQGFDSPNVASVPTSNPTPFVPYETHNAFTNVPSTPASQPSQMGIFAQPMMQDMALQYGQQLANTGKTMVKQEIEKIVPVTKLKYYFAVDNKYVLSKLMLLFFPFTHSDWSIKYEQDGPVQPRFEINAPDLYIPTMAYVTYVLVASLILGMQQRFSPEQIGILASSALAWCLVELAIYSCTLYITNIQTSLRTLDLLAYSGYKFVGIIVSIMLSIIGAKTAYYCTLVYCNIALAFFLVRTLKPQVLPVTTQQQVGYYGENSTTVGGNKRRLYFLLFVAGVQPILSWWLSFHLLGTTKSLASPVVTN